MNKKISKLIAILVVMLMIITSVAVAAPTIGGEFAESNGTYTTTIVVKGVGSADKVTLLVVKSGTNLEDFTSEDILYVAQKKATSGVANFEFVTQTQQFDVYSGYSTKPRTDAPLSYIYETAPSLNSTDSEIASASAPFGIEGCKRVFIKLTNNNGNWVPVHSGEGSEIYYSTELQGYDCLIKTNATDIGAIYNEITWTRGTPTAQNTIEKYGDVTGDGNINTEDYVSLRKSLLGSVTYTNKQKLTADVSGDSVVKTADYIAVRRRILEAITEFATVINKK